MDLQPLNDRLIVRPDEIEKERKSGIVLPDVVQDKTQMGTVTAVGDGYWDEGHPGWRPLRVKRGDRVLFSRYAGVEVNLGDPLALSDAGLLVLRESDVLAIVNT